LHILHTEASPGWGGQEMRILSEALGMAQKGHTIILAVQKGGKLVSRARKKGFIVYELDFKKIRFFSLLWEFRKIFMKEKIDIINTHSSIDSWIAGICGRLYKIPLVRTRHLSTKIRKGINSYLLYNKLADRVVTTCQEMVPIIEKQAKKPSSYLQSIPTGVDIDTILSKKVDDGSFRLSLNIDPADFLVGMVCFMRSWKGVDDFIDAAYLSKDLKGISWVLIGGGHEEKYRKKAAAMHVQNLYFTGHLENVFSALSSLDVFCLLSTGCEGVSQASLQAALYEKPLITTSTGGLKEVCIDKKTGVQVPCFSPKKVKEAVLFMKNNPAKAKKMGLEGKKLVLKTFSYKKMLEDMEHVFIQTLFSSN
jgi:glycosyltransferase involved in cell wall biosynthesis